jgi:hypothetical protein
MQTAQKVITAYRRKRIIVCLLVALLTLGHLSYPIYFAA